VERFRHHSLHKLWNPSYELRASVQEITPWGECFQTTERSTVKPPGAADQLLSIPRNPTPEGRELLLAPTGRCECGGTCQRCQGGIPGQDRNPAQAGDPYDHEAKRGDQAFVLTYWQTFF
jgi:hypothetical protein